MSGENNGGAAAQPSEFDKLLKSLEAVGNEAATLAKGGAAAVVPGAEGAEGGEGAAEAGDEGAGEEEDPDGKDGEGEPFGKSLVVKNADGSEAEALDATEFLKSLVGRVDGTEAALLKGMAAMVQTMTSQGELIKSLSAQVAKLGGQPAPRKAVLIGAEKKVTDLLAKGGMGGEATEGQIQVTELLAKSEAAWKAGKISGIEFNTLDACVRHREAVPEPILRKVAAA